MQNNGSYGFCDKEDAQGVAMDSTPYHIDGMDELAGAETVNVETVEAGAIVMDLAAASAVYASVADADGITPAEISLHPDLFPRLKGDGSLIKAGTHINWNGTIKRAANALWDTVENDPDHAPDLWNDIAYREGLRVLTGPIPATNPVLAGEICWYKDEKWKNISGVPSVYLPDEYPAGWEVVA
jgi:hypothetical protein